VADLVFDTSILVDHTRGIASALAYVRALRHSIRPCAHTVSAAEFLSGARNKKEWREAELYLSQFRMIVPNAGDFRQCLMLLGSHRLRDGIGWPDCLIAASCLRLGIPILTLNDKHFRVVKTLKVIRPY
jgi:predicted nucleic acid-binding protein